MDFQKYRDNPVLLPDRENVFDCPINGPVRWEEKDVFNPAAVVKDGRVYLLYRAEDTKGRYAGTSRVGIAESEDGFSFHRNEKPVLYPCEDGCFYREREGGCEDPRIAESPDGLYIMTYTAFDGELPQLFVASSRDLLHWDKRGYAFRKAADEGRFDAGFRCKSGAVLCEMRGGRLIAAKINGKYLMYWGEGVIYAAVSDNLIDWEPVKNTKSRSCAAKRSSPSHIKWSGDKRLYCVLDGRKGMFDSWLVEPGPPPVLTERGIVMLYNGASKNFIHKPRGIRYCVGRALLDPKDPLTLSRRDATPVLAPELGFETEGQVNRVCFAEGLVFHNGKWILYYGTADSKIAAAYSDFI